MERLAKRPPVLTPLAVSQNALPSGRMTPMSPKTVALTLVSFLFAGALFARAAGLSAREHLLVDYANAHRNEAETLLGRLVEINSAFVAAP